MLATLSLRLLTNWHHFSSATHYAQHVAWLHLTIHDAANALRELQQQVHRSEGFFFVKDGPLRQIVH